MYVYCQRCGDATNLEACSSNKDKLRRRMKSDVEDFIREHYDEEDETLGIIPDVTDDMDFWSDEDDEYEIVFFITEVEEI